MLSRLVRTLTVALRRLLAQPWLAGLSLVGFALPVALAMSIPLYAESVYRRTLIQQIEETEARYRTTSLFDFIFHYNGGYGNRRWDEIGPADSYILADAGDRIGLPHEPVQRIAITQPYPLYPGEIDLRLDTPPAWGQFATIGDLVDHITLVEGRLWEDAEGATMPVQALLSTTQANQQGLQIGDQVTLAAAPGDVEVPARIVGVWRPTDPQDDVWFIEPDAMSDWLVVSETAFRVALDQRLGAPVYMAWWHLAADASSIGTNDVMPLIAQISEVYGTVQDLRPEMEMSTLPLRVLETYRQSARVLTVLLSLYSLPVMGLLAVFVVLVALLVTEHQRNVVAMLRSRGASRPQVMVLTTWEAVLVGVAAFAAGVPSSLGVAYVLSRARSFLDFSGPGDPSGNVAALGVWLGVVTLVLGIACRLVPLRRAARNTIVDYRAARSRAPRLPRWQRMGLDLLLMIPAAYGTYLLRAQGTLAILDPLRNRNPFQNPLLFLVPALWSLSGSLLLLRLMPVLLSAVAWLTKATRSVGLLTASRHMSRSPSTYAVPVLLLVMTLTLAVYTATLAGTLDRELHDRAYYGVGADMMFLDIGEGGPDVTPSDFLGMRQVTFGTPAQLSQPANAAAAAAAWTFPPVLVYRDLPGAADVTRVGRYAATLRESTPSGSLFVSGPFLGVDPGDFARVAFWRADFAEHTLGELMTRLSSRADALLVPCSQMGFHAPGDLVQLSVYTYQRSDTLAFTLVGCFDLFPTWYPASGAGNAAGAYGGGLSLQRTSASETLFVANLDYLYTTIGQTYPFEVWLTLEPGVDVIDIANTPIGGVNRYRQGWGWEAANLDIHAVQEEPRRQGLFGILSVGFITASGLSVVGVNLHLLFSFRRRRLEFGVLRAVGLPARQMARILAWEMAILLIASAVMGTGLGIAVSRAFIPYLQVEALGQSTVPPYIVSIDWSATVGVYGVFAALFVLALLVLVVLLRRLRIFEALKLGDTL